MAWGGTGEARRTATVAVWTVALSLVCAGLSAAFHPQAPSLSHMRHEEGRLESDAVRARGDWIWVDARERHEFEAGSLPGAILLNETEWERLLPDFLERWEPGSPVLVFCGSDSCPAARAVRARLMRELGAGADSIYFLGGGLEAWNR